jgi:uncharacterized membrane protein YhaH (DUF805 family)
MDQIDINKVWQNFVDTVTNHYTDFDGRIGRTQFWYYVVAYAVVGIGAGLVSGIVVIAPLQTLYVLALLLPSVGITARRLQDTGKPGSWAWLTVVPIAVIALSGIVGIAAFLTFGLLAILLAPLWYLLWLASLAATAVVVYFCAQPGTAGPNAFGPAPAAWTPSSPAKPTAPPAS